MTTTSSRGILMQGDRVRAILEDRKSQTRRLRGLTKLNSGPYKDRINKVECRDGAWCFWGIWGSSALPVFHAKCPYGVPVDLLYLKAFRAFNTGLTIQRCTPGRWTMGRGTFAG